MSTKSNQLPSLDLLNYLFKVDEASYSGLSWKNPRAKKIKPGDSVGYKTNQGYWRVSIRSGRRDIEYGVHRIVFFMSTEIDPGDNYIDHIDGDRSNNKIENLRIANNSQNLANSEKPRNRSKSITSSQYKGVSWHKGANKWRAGIVKNGVTYDLGLFKNEVDAAIAYDVAASKLFGEYARMNFVEDPDDLCRGGANLSKHRSSP